MNWVVNCHSPSRELVRWWTFLDFLVGLLQQPKPPLTNLMVFNHKNRRLLHQLTQNGGSRGAFTSQHHLNGVNSSSSRSRGGVTPQRYKSRRCWFIMAKPQIEYHIIETYMWTKNAKYNRFSFKCMYIYIYMSCVYINMRKYGDVRVMNQKYQILWSAVPKSTKSVEICCWKCVLAVGKKNKHVCGGTRWWRDAQTWLTWFHPSFIEIVGLSIESYWSIVSWKGTWKLDNKTA